MSFRRAIVGVTSASLLLTTTLVPGAMQFPGAGLPGAMAQQAASVYSAEELEAILAPIALYPDQLLTQMLMAASYPDQLAEADRWARDSAARNLRGEALDMALRPLPWDPAVKSLVPFPQVLDMMISNTEWTAQLAFAITQQQGATFDAIQWLRRRARDAGQLRGNDRETVRVDNGIIVIEPAQPDVVYVPVYNPSVVYGAWPYPVYQPYYFPPAYAVPQNALAAGIFFGAGVAVAASLWGWTRPAWHERHIFVDPGRFETFRRFHHPPPGDWRDWRDNGWHPPPRPSGAALRPPPFRPEGERPQPQPRPGTPQVQPPPPRPGREPVHPPGTPQVEPRPSRPGAEPVRPPGTPQVPPRPSRPGGEGVHPPGTPQVQPQPSRPGGEGVHPPGTPQVPPRPSHPGGEPVRPPGGEHVRPVPQTPPGGGQPHMSPPAGGPVRPAPMPPAAGPSHPPPGGGQPEPRQHNRQEGGPAQENPRR